MDRQSNLLFDSLFNAKIRNIIFLFSLLISILKLSEPMYTKTNFRWLNYRSSFTAIASILSLLLVSHLTKKPNIEKKWMKKYTWLNRIVWLFTKTEF